MTDEWNQCFNPAMGLSPKDFGHTWCRVCMNAGCSRSASTGSKWQGRMATQVERLLTNPNFADPRDPAFQEVRKLDFPSLFQEAMRLEISDRKGDWTVPTAQDVRDFVAGTLGVPKPPPEVVTPPPLVSVEQEPEVVTYRMPVRGGADVKTGEPHTYDVRLVALPAHPEGQEWRCSCPAWIFARARPCKHVEYVMGQYASAQAPPEVQVESTPTVAPRVFVPGPPPMPIPKTGNTPTPPGGAYVGATRDTPASRPDIRHATPPAVKPAPSGAPDPWASPPVLTPGKSDTIVPVGGRVTMGGPKR